MPKKTVKLLEPEGITVTHKTIRTMERLISNPKENLKTDDRRDFIYKVKCED